MTIQTFASAVEAEVLVAEACLEKHEYKDFLREVQESCKRRLEYIESHEKDYGLTFLLHEDEE
jgi:hypothetical protein